jgi:hypothetical protein
MSLLTAYAEFLSTIIEQSLESTKVAFSLAVVSAPSNTWSTIARNNLC